MAYIFACICAPFTILRFFNSRKSCEVTRGNLGSNFEDQIDRMSIRNSYVIFSSEVIQGQKFEKMSNFIPKPHTPVAQKVADEVVESSFLTP